MSREDACIHGVHQDRWPTSKLHTVAEISPESLPALTPGDFEFRYIDISSVSRGVIDWSSVATINFSSAPSRARRVVRPCDVLLSTVRPGLQSHAFANWNEQDGYVASTGFAVIRSGAELNPRFLYHFVFSELAAEQIRRLEVGSSYPAINETDVRRLEIPHPNIGQQRRIAEILDTLDDAIQKTEQLIAKLKQIKQGLLHDLLTRGIDENGQLRDPITHPELFKDSVLGRIPASWNILGVGDVLEGVIDFRGRTPKKLGMDWGGGNIPALSANNVEMGQINLSKETYYGSEKIYSKWMSSGDAACGDVVMTLEAPLGNIAQIPDDRRYILSQRTILLKTRSDLVDNDFLRHQLMSDQFQRALVRESTGTTAAGIQRAKLVRLAIKVPPVKEQRMIADRMQAADEELGREEKFAAKLSALKKGLMRDLLTGTVRVQVREGEGE